MSCCYASIDNAQILPEQSTWQLQYGGSAVRATCLFQTPRVRHGNTLDFRVILKERLLIKRCIVSFATHCGDLVLHQHVHPYVPSFEETPRRTQKGNRSKRQRTSSTRVTAGKRPLQVLSHILKIANEQSSLSVPQ